MYEGAPFYVTLPSDVATEATNTASNWTTKLKHPITLKGKWEMALVELQYLNSFYTLPVEKKIQVNIVKEFRLKKDDTGFIESVDYVIHQDEITIPPGNFKNAELLLQTINSLVPKVGAYMVDDTVHSDKSALSHDRAFTVQFLTPTNHRVRLNIGNDRVSVVFPPGSSILQKILGFDSAEFKPDVPVESHGNARGPFPMETKTSQIKYLSFLTKPPNPKLSTFISERPVNTLLGNQKEKSIKSWKHGSTFRITFLFYDNISKPFT
ncbi:uncharacterized protein LOC129598059 [Paramacrobiotus metropolitanus]|uniref:uncharacterized protein LOC129598059 n=1 Tax=Paramacrobiotus metropolitanus TaxID=2943436 RepID=UPI00244569BA|nr:uncharacterized protein LOC129598059 [Paramacrobiotus metropolitanus]